MGKFGRSNAEKRSTLRTLEKSIAKRDYEYNKWFKKQSAFYQWFCTFLEEKCIDLSLFTSSDNVQVGDVCQGICDTTKEEQRKIKETLVKIDFVNGDVYHYFNHLAKALE